MALNLTDLDDLELSVSQHGKALELPIDKVIEDPEQPRKSFAAPAMKAMEASIRDRGVRSPISVKPPNAEGLYVINHGARRYRASIMAEKRTIPAFIDETHTSYDQVSENIHREALNPMEIALFAHSRLLQGEKKGAIAKHLSQANSFVSEHLALLDAPDFLQTLARNREAGAKTLYVLSVAYKEFPQPITRYVKGGSDLSRAAVTRFIESLRGAKAGKSEGRAAGAVATAPAGKGGAAANEVLDGPGAPSKASRGGADVVAAPVVVASRLQAMLDELDGLSADGSTDSALGRAIEEGAGDLKKIKTALRRLIDRVRVLG